MDLEKDFHMAGEDDDYSYAKNSSYQKNVSDGVKQTFTKALQEVYLLLRPKSLGVADLGCSSGPNTLSFIKETVESVANCRRRRCDGDANGPEFIGVYLNDLPKNDFNSIFKSLPDLYKELHKEIGGEDDDNLSLSVAAYPGSFYGRLLADDFLQLIYSSFSLHWLSKVPQGLYDEQGRSINKGKIYISETSPPGVAQAYESLFQQDFSLFLQSRSPELVTRGRMMLIFIGRIGDHHVDRGASYFLEILSRSLAILVSHGKIDKEKLDSFDLHMYAALKDEVEAVIRRNGSFAIEQLDTLEIEHLTNGTYEASATRAVFGPLLGLHFGDEIVDHLFDIVAVMVEQDVAAQEARVANFLLVLRKLLSSNASCRRARIETEQLSISLSYCFYQ